MEIRKVTDPAKRITDPVLLSALTKQGIDKDYVEFWHDYAPRSRGPEYSPTAKFYRDLRSGQHIGIFSRLPKVKALGHKIEVGWLYAKGRYYSRANLFFAIVKGKHVQITCLSDQPTGAKKGDRVTYKPQLFIDGVEIVNGSEPTLLHVDPINENYQENTLEWTYGNICKRRLRIIEGRIRDKFFILSHPHNRVSVKNNCVGNLKLRLGHAYDAEGNPLKVTVIGDEEIIESSEFDGAVYPVEIGASMTFYPGIPTFWTRDGNNPLFGESPQRGGLFEILKEDATHYHLYFCDSEAGPPYSIKHATSSSVDGTFGSEEMSLATSAEHGGFSILKDPATHIPIKLSEDDLGISGDTTQKYWLFYGDTDGDISIATNTSLSGAWTIEAGLNPCLERSAGQWDAYWLGFDGLVVFKDGDTFYMLYEGWDDDPYNFIKGGLATSTNLADWSKSGSNPVFSGTVDEWDYHSVRVQDIWKTGGTFILLYTGRDTVQHDDEALGIATATVLTSWTKDTDNPKFESSEGSWEGDNVSDFCLFRGDKDYIFYESGSVGVGRAWCDDILAEVPAGGTVDGYVTAGGLSVVWADLRGHVGTAFNDSSTTAYACRLGASDTEDNKWRDMRRGIVLFDTSPLPNTCVKTAATFSIRGSHKAQTANGPDPYPVADTSVYKSAPASNIALEAGDFDSLDDVALATPITYAAFDAAGWNNFVLIDVDADGFGYIPKDAVTKLGTRNANYDAANSEPSPFPGQSKIYDIRFYTAEQGNGYKPKLVVTYEAPPAVEKKHTFRLDPRPRKRLTFHPNLKLG